MIASLSANELQYSKLVISLLRIDYIYVSQGRLVPDQNSAIATVQANDCITLHVHCSCTHHRKGCGNNMHVKCMVMYAEHKRSGRNAVTCCLCRADWGPLALVDLKTGKFSC
jgi:hypothetical protein